MMETAMLILGFSVFLGVPLYKVFSNIKKVIDRDYIFHMKFVKVKGDKLEFKRDFDNHKIPIIKLVFNDIKYNFLVDTGANINLINSSVFDTISEGKIEVKKNGFIQTASKQENTNKAIIDFKYINKHFTEEFVLMDLDTTFASVLKTDGIQLHGVLGSDFFFKHRWSVDFDNMVIWTK